MRILKNAAVLCIGIAMGYLANQYFPLYSTELLTSVVSPNNNKLTEDELIELNAKVKSSLMRNPTIKCIIVPAGNGSYNLNLYNTAGIRDVPQPAFRIAERVTTDFLLRKAIERGKKKGIE